MNLLKHMEAVFVVAVALAVSGSQFINAMPQAHARAVASEDAQAAPGTVVITAKRMSPREKTLPLPVALKPVAARG